MDQTRQLFGTIAIAAVIASCIGLSSPALAQRAPSQSGSVIVPMPEPRFGGVIGRKASEFEAGLSQSSDGPQGRPEHSAHLD